MRPELETLRRCSTWEEIAEWVHANSAFLFRNAFPSRPVPADFEIVDVEISGRYIEEFGWVGKLVISIPEEIGRPHMLFGNTGIDIRATVTGHGRRSRREGFLIHDFTVMLRLSDFETLRVREKLAE